MIGGRAQYCHKARDFLWKVLPPPGKSLRVLPDRSQLKKASNSLAMLSMRRTWEALHPLHRQRTRPDEVVPLRFILRSQTGQIGAFIPSRQTRQLKNRLYGAIMRKNPPQCHTFCPTSKLPQTNFNTDFPAPQQRKTPVPSIRNVQPRNSIKTISTRTFPHHNKEKPKQNQ